MTQVIPVFNMWIVGRTEDPEFVLGPFESKTDAEFIADMFDKGKLEFKGARNDGKANLEDAHPVHQHTR